MIRNLGIPGDSGGWTAGFTRDMLSVEMPCRVSWPCRPEARAMANQAFAADYRPGLTIVTTTRKSLPGGA
jgi:hypothetical protein